MQLALCRTYADLCSLFAKNVEIHNLQLITHDIMIATYKNKARSMKPAKGTSLFAAIWTTSHARAKLITTAQQIGNERVLYIDTVNLHMSKPCATTYFDLPFRIQ